MAGIDEEGKKHMNGNSRIRVALSPVILMAIGLVIISCSENRDPEFKLAPKALPEATQADTPANKGVEVGTGWGEGEPAEAVRKALGMALKGKANRNPDFMIIHPTAGSDCEKILQEVRNIVGTETRIYGGTSDARGVLSDGGYVAGAKGGYAAAAEGIEAGLHGLAVMTISSREIEFGVGSASVADHGSASEAAVAALGSAVKNAGKNEGRKPSFILITPTIGIEHQVLKGVEQAVGSDVILLGGTAGGPNGNAIGNDHAYSEGVSFALFYTDLPVGWVFEAGFDKQDEFSGVVTKMDGRRIVEIDNEPAYDVYDRWLGGEVTRLRLQGEETDTFRDFLSLHPLFRKFESPDGSTYSVFSHPWAPNKDLITNGLNTTTDIKVGERVYLSYGTWEALLNRIGSLPGSARESIALDENAPVSFAIGTICAGVLGVIPDEERKKFPVLINHANGKAPFIASITWGEQGVLPGVGFQHCNLTTSFLVIGTKK
jgi:hypothetical protein